MKIFQISLTIFFLSVSSLVLGNNFAASLSLSTSSICGQTSVNVTVSGLNPFASGVVRIKYTVPQGQFITIQTQVVNFENTTSISYPITISDESDFSAEVDYEFGTDETTNTRSVSTVPLDGGVLSSGGSSSPATICSGDAATIDLTGAEGNLTWYINEENNIWTPIGNQGNSFTVSPTTTTKYRVRASHISCSVTDDSNEFTVNVVSATKAGSVSSSVNNRCGSGAVNLSIAGHVGTIHRWQSRYRNGSGSWSGWSTFEETNDVTSRNLSLNQWNSGVRTYQMRAVVQSGTSCAVLYPSTSVTVEPSNYTWSISPSSAGSINSSGTVSWNLGFAGTATISVTANGSCNNTTSNKLVVVTPLVNQVSITDGVSSRCQASSTSNFNADASNAIGYSWSIIPSSAGSISSSGNVSWSSDFSGTVTVSVTANGTCNSTTDNKTVIVNPLVGPVSLSSGVSTRCQSLGSTDYNASASNATGYSWAINPSSAGTINSSGTVSWNPTFSGTATVTITATGCNSSTSTASQNVVVDPIVSGVAINSGSLDRCQGSTSEAYGASASNADDFTWSISPTTAGSINAETGIVQWNANFSGTATISVIAYGCNGSNSSTDVSVTVNPQVSAAIITDGPTIKCQGDDSDIYKVDAQNATSYSWSINPSNAGSIDQAGNVNWDGNFFGTATISATAYGCNAVTNVATRTVSVSQNSIGGTVAGTTEEFGVASGTLSLSSQVGDIVKWQYKINDQWEDINSSTSDIDYTNVQETTTFRAVINNGSCDDVFSSEAIVTILDIPSVDLGITEQVRPGHGTILTASEGHADYTWIRNDGTLGGDEIVQAGSSNSYSADMPGTYKVTITSYGNATYTTGNAIIANQLGQSKCRNFLHLQSPCNRCK